LIHVFGVVHKTRSSSAIAATEVSPQAKTTVFLHSIPAHCLEFTKGSGDYYYGYCFIENVGNPFLKRFYSKRQKVEGRRQNVYYCYVVVSAVNSVLTFMATMATAISRD
jgi:hypothetical protein